MEELEEILQKKSDANNRTWCLRDKIKGGGGPCALRRTSSCDPRITPKGGPVGNNT